MAKIYIIILNWNGWRDTIECLESVMRLEYPSFRVIVCDNASADGSMDRIAEWASGALDPQCSNPELQHLTAPPCSKPIPVLKIEAGVCVPLNTRSEKLFLAQTGQNLGFAGGMNVGLRLALDAGDMDYAWLLNNDTVVDPEALSTLVATMQERPEVGICGSTLLYYHAPRTVQALGGSTYNRWTARVGHIGLGIDVKDAPPRQTVQRLLQYIVGASMMVSHPFLEGIGLLNEQYFLYFEEIDWATRAKGKFSITYCPESFVYHKEGASIGSSGVKSRRSRLSELFASRNRILFTRLYYPVSLITVLPALLVSAIHRLVTGQFANFAMLVRGISSGLFNRQTVNSKTGPLSAKSIPER